MSPKTKLVVLSTALFLVLFSSVRAFSAPFTAVYPQTILVNTTLPVANHVLLFAYPFPLGQYRLFYNDSGNLYPLTQMVLDGAIVVQNYDPRWYTGIVLLNVSSYGLNTSVTPAYSFVAGSQKLLSNGGTLYSRNGYMCLSAPSAVSYLYVPNTLSVSGSMVYFYGYVFNSTLDSYSRIGFSKTFGDVAYSTNPGVQALFTSTTVYVADASYQTFVTTSTATPQNKLMLVMAKRSTYLTVWNYTSTWYDGNTGSAGLAATTYYANIKVNTGKAVCAGLLALSAAPVPFFSASYVAKTVSVPLVVYSSQPFNVTYPKTYSSISLFLSKNAPAGTQKLSLSVPAGTVSLLDSSMNPLFTFSLKAQSIIMLDGTNITYIKVNGNIYYLHPLSGQVAISPPSNPSTITFTVQDYGAGYQVLQVYDLQGRVAGSGLIGSTGQVAMNLTPYAGYMITVCKAGICKSVGLVTISSSNIQLSVMPSIPSVNPPSWASASYDYSGKALRVNVSCASPPCTVRIYKSVVWYNSWQMRLPVSLSAGWNLVFLKKSSTVSASGMWAYINASSWSEIRFGDAGGLPENFLTYSIIWSNSTHAQVLVYAPQSGTYYLYWQSQVQVTYANVSNPLVTTVNGVPALVFKGNNYGVLRAQPPLSSGFTFATWVAFSPYTGYANIFNNNQFFIRKSSSWEGNYTDAFVKLSDGSVGPRAGGVVALAGKWYHLAATWNTTHLSMYVNGKQTSAVQRKGNLTSTTVAAQIGRGEQTNTNINPFFGYISQVLIYSRVLSSTEIAQLYQNPANPPTSGLVLWLTADPRYLYDLDWDGYVDWIDLSGSGNHATLYNFHSRGSFMNAPQRQPSSMLVITQTCNTQLCSYTVNSEDPFFTVIATDSSGKTAQTSTGLSVPLWQSPLGIIVNTIGRVMNLDAWGVNINDFVVLLIGLAVIYAAFTYRNWELAIIVFGVWLSVGTLLLGGSGRLMVPGISLALVGAAISYMLKREQAP
jgi:hypothetical protein